MLHKKVIFKICHRIFVFIYRPLFWSVIKINIFMERQRFYVTIWYRKIELLIFINITSPVTTSPKILVQNEFINFVVCNTIKLDSKKGRSLHASSLFILRPVPFYEVISFSSRQFFHELKGAFFPLLWLYLYLLMQIKRFCIFEEIIF